MTTPVSPTLSDTEIGNSYIYLLSRLLVLRQQHLDFQERFKWNALVHRKPGEVDWPNPNLDVAYSEAWVAVDEKSCLVVSVPKITGRYYTVQFLNGWGETVANINERVFPQRPSGEFAICLQGSQVPVPAGAQRIDVPVKYMRADACRARLELGRGRCTAKTVRGPRARPARSPDDPHDSDLRYRGVARCRSVRGGRGRARQ